MLTDIHQHLVYGVDDGPQDITLSMAMLKKACEQGVRTIFCTAHDCPGVHPLDKMQYAEHLRELQRMAKQEQMDVSLLSGSELMFTPELLMELQEGKILSLADTHYLLIEFYPDIPWPLLKKVVSDIQQAGYRVVLAHFERYECLREVGRAKELRQDLGVLLQMNAGSVLESQKLIEGRWLRKMLKKHVVDLIASDAHNTENRCCRLADAYLLITRKYGKDYAEQVCSLGPNMLLTDRRE